VVVHVLPAGVLVTRYPVMGRPACVVTGADHLTVTSSLPGEVLTPTGAPGTAAGLAVLDGADVGPVPRELWAMTVNVYVTPFVRPVTKHVSVVVVVHCFRPGVLVTV
jgi:hypothetical protein